MDMAAILAPPVLQPNTDEMAEEFAHLGTIGSRQGRRQDRSHVAFQMRDAAGSEQDDIGARLVAGIAIGGIQQILAAAGMDKRGPIELV